MLFEYNTEIAGSNYYFESVYVEPGDALVIFRDRDNKHDKNALQILHKNKLVGYVKRQIAAEICAQLEINIVYMECECTYIRSSYDIGIKILGFLILRIE